MDGLLEAAQAEWAYLQGVCVFEGNPLRDIRIKIDWDPYIKNTTLAWARYTRILHEGAWIPILLTDHTFAVDVEIGVNPNIQWSFDCEGGGWSLKSTLLHELLHAAGISSSATKHGVGYAQACTPTLMDTKMKMADGSPAVQGCHLKEGDIYVGNTRLHRGHYQSGVSLNHHVHAGSLMHPTPPYGCALLGPHEEDILNTLGYTCHLAGGTSYGEIPNQSKPGRGIRISVGRIFAWAALVCSAILAGARG